MQYKIVDDEIGLVKNVKERMIEGVGIRFGSPETKDHDGDFFYDETVTGMRNGSDRPFMMQHGFSVEFGKAQVGTAIFEKSNEAWVYVATFDDTVLGNKAYAEVTSKPYRSSSGAGGHTVSTSKIKGANRIETWMVAEISGTQFPNDSQNGLIQQRTKSDYMAQMLFEISETNKAFLTEYKTANELFQKMLVDSINNEFKGMNDQRTALAEKMLELHNSFTQSGEQFKITPELLKALDEEVKPIKLITFN